MSASEMDAPNSGMERCRAPLGGRMPSKTMWMTLRGSGAFTVVVRARGTGASRPSRLWQLAHWSA